MIYEAESVESFLNSIPRLAKAMKSRIEKVRERVSDYLTVLEPSSKPLRIAAIDSAFPTTPLEMLGFSVAPIAAVAVWGLGRVEDRKVERRILYSFDETVDSESIALRARLLERKLMAFTIAKGVELLAVDGELLVGGKGFEEAAYRLSLKVLEEALARGITVAGVVKRSRASYLASRLGINVSDKALAALILKPCEALILDHPDKALRDLGCRLVYYKPPRGLAVSVKLEVCGNMDRAGWLACSVGWSGLPWVVDVVDALAKSEVERLYRLLEYRVRGRAVAEGILELAAPLNPQEVGSRRRSGG